MRFDARSAAVLERASRGPAVMALRLSRAQHAAPVSNASRILSGVAGPARLAGMGAVPGGAYVSSAEGAYSIIKSGSGATGASAASGAETGASVGTAIVPGIGTAIGLIIGAAAGALLSAFGGGRRDPETASWNAFIQAYSQNPAVVNQLSAPAAFQLMAGIMDAKNNSPGHSSALELAFGRMGENRVVVQMANVINAATRAGQISYHDTPITVYNRIVKPWLISKNAYIKPTDVISSNGSRAGGAVDAIFEVLIAAWISGYLKSTTPMGIAGQPISGLPPFVGLPQTQQPAASRVPAPTQLVPARTAATASTQNMLPTAPQAGPGGSAVPYYVAPTGGISLTPPTPGAVPAGYTGAATTGGITSPMFLYLGGGLLVVAVLLGMKHGKKG